MAILAAAVALMDGGKIPTNPLFVKTIDITCDDTYPAGGWPVSTEIAALLENNAQIVGVIAENLAQNGYVPEYDSVNGKLRIWESAVPVAAALVDLSTANAMDGEVVRLTIFAL